MYELVLAIFFVIFVYCAIEFAWEYCNDYPDMRRLTYQESLNVYYALKEKEIDIETIMEIKLPGEVARGSWDVSVPIPLEEWNTYGAIWKVYVPAEDYQIIKTLRRK